MTEIEAVKQRLLDAQEPGYGTRNRRAVLAESLAVIGRLEMQLAWQWTEFSVKAPPADEMILWAWFDQSRSTWKLGSAYRSVSGSWVDSEGVSRISAYATHWKPIGPPPC